MRLAHRLFLLFTAGHAAAVLAALFLPLPDPLAGLAGASLYGPLRLFRSLGLPVFDATEANGWSFPSAFGVVLVIAFWLAAWLLAGHAVAFAVRRLRRA